MASEANKVREAFLRAQLEAAKELTERSDIVEVTPLEGDPPERYIADFRCKSYARSGDSVHLVDRVLVGIQLPENYLHVFEPQRVIAVLAPLNLWHPNVRGPLLCPGFLIPGTPLVDLVTQVYEVLTAHRITLAEQRALHPEVCSWARANRSSFPTERRPLRRQAHARSHLAAVEEGN
jgi:hypothetical protein